MINLGETNIITSEAQGNPFTFAVKVYWDDVNPTDETANVSNFTLSFRATGDDGVLSLGKPVSTSASITFDNDSDRFTDYLSSSPLYSYISDGGWYGKKVELWLGFLNDAGVPEGAKRFTGRIYGWSHQLRAKTVTAQLVDQSSFFMLNRQVFSLLYEDIKSGQLLQNLINALPAAVRPPIGTIFGGDVTIPFAWFDGDNPIAELGDIAMLEGGMVRLDGNGSLSFYSAGDALGSSIATMDVSYADDCTIDYEFQSTAQKVKVGYRQPILFYNEKLWTLREPVYIPPGETASITAQFEPSVNRNVLEYDVFSIGGVAMEDVVPYMVRYDATRAVFQFDNTLNDMTAVVWRLEIGGRQLQFQDEKYIMAVMRNGAIVFEDWDDSLNESGPLKTIEVIGNWYIQSESMARRVATLQLWRATKPTVRVQLSGYGGVFWYDPLDVVTLDFGSTTMPAVIAGMQLRGEYRNVSVDLELYPISVFLPAWGDFFRLGVDAIGGGKRYYA